MLDGAEGPGRPSSPSPSPALKKHRADTNEDLRQPLTDSLPHFAAARRGAQFVEDSGASRRPEELELTTVLPNIHVLSNKVVEDEKLGECVQRAIEELGVDNSSAYIMFDDRMMKVEQTRPDVFQHVRRLVGVSERYLTDLCNGPFEAPPEWVQHRPAWTSASGRFVVEVVQADQVAYFSSIADRYLNHIEKHPDSLICSMVGLYAIYDKAQPSGRCHVVVLKNFLPTGAGRKMDYLYDIRGVEKDRFVTRTGAAAQLLQDANFVQEQQVVMLARDRQLFFKEALEADASFLKEIRSVGYSLMLGIRKSSENGEASLPPLPSSSAHLEVPGLSRRNLGQRAHSGQADDDPDELLTRTARPSDSSGSRTSPGFEGSHTQVGWRPNARAKSAEQVTYYFGIVDVLQPWNFRKGMKYAAGKVASGFIGPLEIEPPRSYQYRFIHFIEDRVLPLNSPEDFFKLESFPQMQRHRGKGGLEGVADGLSLAAAAEAEDELRTSRGEPFSPAELARWHCFIDALEAGEDATQRWVELGLVEDGVLRGFDSFRADLARRRLPPNCTGAKHHPSGVALLKIGKLVNSVAKAHSLKGKLLSNSSTQYSLALAIAVGVEAATHCSARICKRCTEVFKQSPELVNRPAAVLAKRTFALPEEGSWLSPPHMLPDLHFVEHAPEVFRRIRFLSGLTDQMYVHCVCQREFSFIEFTTNSKSGEFFFFTHDGRCMVKTISSAEAEALLRLLHDGYAEHLSAPSGSLLTRIYGLYQVQLPWFKGGKPKYFMIQENVLFTTSKMLERFDLKGSTRGRTAKPGESVQKDNDWIDRDMTFGFEPEMREKIQMQHRRDCEFLAHCRVVDYSLLVGICDTQNGGTPGNATLSLTESSETSGRPSFRPGHKACMSRLRNVVDTPKDDGDRITVILSKRKPGELWNKLREEVWAVGPHGPLEGRGYSLTSSQCQRRCYFLGIIDFLVTWSCRKKTEYAWRFIQCQASSASVNPPWEYARRQMEFIERIL